MKFFLLWIFKKNSPPKLKYKPFSPPTPSPKVITYSSTTFVLSFSSFYYLFTDQSANCSEKNVTQIVKFPPKTNFRQFPFSKSCIDFPITLSPSHISTLLFTTRGIDLIPKHPNHAPV